MRILIVEEWLRNIQNETDRISVFQALAVEQDIVIENKVTEDVMIAGDPNRITQLFTILLDNAMKYMGRPGTIKVEASNSNHHAIITFSDDGVGIPKEEVSGIFTRFYRVDKACSRNHGGSGLGLSIAKWIVEAHHGKITATSETNKGVTYKIII